MQVKKQQLKLDMEQQTGKLGKEYVKAVSGYTAYLTFAEYNTAKYQSYSWKTHQLESRLTGEISVTSDMQMTLPLMSESEEELKSHLMEVKQESQTVGLKLNIQKTNIMASGPITSWQIDGEAMETMT